MPRGKKSKHRARDKRQQARNEARRVRSAQASTEEGEDSDSSCSLSYGVSSLSTPEPVLSQEPRGAAAASGSVKPKIAWPCFDTSAESRSEESAGASQAESGSEGPRRSPLDQKAMLLAQFMLRKYNMKEPIIKEDMMKHVIKKHKLYFQEILKRASELMVLAFGIDVKEADPGGHSYVLVSKLHQAGDSRLSGEIMPKKGLLMTILCVIFMKGNCATEEEIWDVLNAMGIHAGKQHNLHGEPMKLITEDLVKEGYLVYRQVPHSDPPSHEFLWGPQACEETSKMEVLQFLAKLHGTQPSAFPLWYEEALQDELERTRRRFAAVVRTSTLATFCSPDKY
ncbi:melanoma-associated antigen B10-like [Pipistrellus kuhlii]|uniref:melanoma-associated antigen B10-like n=1 Tax=Pipistrellus kuhlii TaxID=59472 RepID=UPI00174F4285|nr:melanoma-associated antigen B10-like [Pipistrellus kuhlii]